MAGPSQRIGTATLNRKPEDDWTWGENKVRKIKPGRGPYEDSVPKWKGDTWKTEPSEISWVSMGFPCKVKRHPQMKSLCGYVLVPATHGLYGLDETDLRVYELNVHGGITFTGEMDVTLNGAVLSGKWWGIGFDCGHAGDYAPGMDELLTKVGGVGSFASGGQVVYRNMEYVSNETTDLAVQIAQMKEEE